VEEQAAKEHPSPEGNACHIPRQEPEKIARDEEEDPRPLPEQSCIITNARNRHQLIHNARRKACKDRVMECCFYGSTIEPHCAEQLVPERRHVQHDHLPQQQPPRPDGHGDRLKECARLAPVLPLEFKSGNRKRFNARSDHQDESDVAQQGISASEHHAVTLMEGIEEQHACNGHDARPEADEHAEECGEECEVEAVHAERVFYPFKDGEAVVIAREDPFQVVRENARIAVVVGNVLPFHQQIEPHKKRPADAH